MGTYVSNKAMRDEQAIIGLLRQESKSLNGPQDLKPLMDRIGDAHIVMLGEATHGTHECYTWRAQLSKRLITEKGFSFIAVEGDWPDAFQLNRYIKGSDTTHRHASELLANFRRWPTWMWANWEVAAMASWMRDWNRTQKPDNHIGFYGLDVYSLWESMDNIMKYLQQHDPPTSKIAEEAMRCFEPYRSGDQLSYTRTGRLVPEICEDEVVNLLTSIRKRMPTYNSDPELVLNIEQNAEIAVNAESYYRNMVQGGPHSWNLRDKHMQDTLERLLRFYGSQAKAIVWAHNSHIGDARATDMTEEGLFNIGELARIRNAEQGVVLVGIGCYSGTVIAGKKWGGNMTRIPLPPCRKGSLEYLLHSARPEGQLIITDRLIDALPLMENPIDHRAVGVVYNPDYEEYSNYVPTIFPLRYDAFIHLDKTRPIHALHIEPDGHEVPETYPFGV